MKKSLITCILLCNLYLPSLLNAALQPSLGMTRTSQSPTSATIIGGGTYDKGVSYVNEFYRDDTIDVVATINIDISHVGQAGRFYVFASISNIGSFEKNSSGIFVPWNGVVADLSGSSSYKTLGSSEFITVIQNLAPSAMKLTGLTMQVHVGYSLMSDPDDIIYNSDAIILNLNSMSRAIGSSGGTNNNDSTEEYYQDNVSSTIQSICINCHISNGLAGITNLVFVNSSTAAYSSANFATIQNFVLNISSGSDLILAKPRGVSHGGGNPLPSGTTGHNNLTELVQRILNDNNGGDGDGDGDAGDGDGDSDGGSTSADFLSGVEYLAAADILRKAAILLTGRLPTQQELDTVEQGNEADLRSTIRNLMQGKNFERFIMEGFNDHFLTEKFLESALFEVVDEGAYPRSQERAYAAEAISEEDGWYVRSQTSRAVAEEPMRLVAHVVSEEKPYTEILTADYIMVNPYSNVAFNSQLTFTDNDDPQEWREGQNNGHVQNIWDVENEQEAQLPVDYPHAGVLNSPAFLARFPSTATNRNRARARWTYQFFLGVNIEALAPRTTDPVALADTNNPTMNNPHCTVCHSVHDPVAGAFQNYGDRGYYRDSWNGLDALPDTYKYEENTAYQWGDTWYRDMRTAGFEGQTVPDADNSLRWLGQQIIADDRFAEGTVKFWYASIFGSKPLIAPAETTDENFATRLRAFEEQDKDIKTWAANFETGSSSYGAYNLKDLLVEMLMSKRFTAASVSNLSTAREDELAEVGRGKLLTPEQLNRKFEALTGYVWGWYDNEGEWGWTRHLIDRYKGFYGGIDSDGVTERNTEINTLMASVIEVMMNENACPITVNDFRANVVDRKLFLYVTPSDTPDTSSGASAIRKNIQYLHEYLLGEKLDLTDPEIDRTYQLFDEIWQRRVRENRETWIGNSQEDCLFNDWSYNGDLHNDPDQTIHSWMIVFRYLVSDYRFLYE